ncbi:thioredoxin family protein [Corynebacterium sp.]|uniref:thioredoxin family protein n=1 Tax=Corynebacterium sp. TaxID=1720 RepID=UPI0026DF95FE|nr:thioredoxin family protein [Corynebacterium sp.]MDO5511555.1 thioredoxin family protein [Corynebacterium sp.]
MTEQVTYDGFGDVLARDGLSLMLFWSTSCGPCLRFHRIYRAVDEKFPAIPFGEAEIEIQQRLVRDLQITTIPALLVYRDGELIYRDPPFHSLIDAPPLLAFMYSEEGFTGFVEKLL